MTAITEAPHVLPYLGSQILFTRYVLVGCSSVIIWDILGNLKSDYALLFKYQIKYPTIVYAISRLTTISCIIVCTIFDTAQIKNCNRWAKAAHLLMTFTISSTSLLFFFRVTAIYEGNKYVRVFFALLWTLVFVGFFVTLHGLEAQSVSLPGPVFTRYCVTTALSSHVVLDCVIPLVYDTLVFLAISWRLAKIWAYKGNLQQGVRAIVFGNYMPTFSRVLYQDGQIYYLTTISAGLLAFIMFLIPSNEDALKTTFIVPNIMLMNIMTCHVFRKTKFGIFPENGISTIIVSQPLAFDSPALTSA